jgi:hypothetical protein
MPYGMPHVVMKGPILRSVETVLNDPGNRTSTLQVIQKDLEGAKPLPDILIQHFKINHGSGSDHHARHHWFPTISATGWWPWLQPIEPLVKAGFAEAICRALKRRPIPWFGCSWLCMPGWDVPWGLPRTDPRHPDPHRQRFAIQLAESKSHITVNIVTPPEPNFQPIQNPQPEPVWFVMFQAPPPGALAGLSTVGKACAKLPSGVTIHQSQTLPDSANG